MQDPLTIEMYVLQVNLVSEQFAKVVVLIYFSFFLSFLSDSFSGLVFKFLIYL